MCACMMNVWVPIKSDLARWVDAFFHAGLAATRSTCGSTWDHNCPANMVRDKSIVAKPFFLQTFSRLRLAFWLLFASRFLSSWASAASWLLGVLGVFLGFLMLLGFRLTFPSQPLSSGIHVYGKTMSSQ